MNNKRLQRLRWAYQLLTNNDYTADNYLMDADPSNPNQNCDKLKEAFANKNPKNSPCYVAPHRLLSAWLSLVDDTLT
jgi:hypothetical protein